jgi:hypothetical protein
VRQDIEAATLLLTHGADPNRGAVTTAGKSTSPLALAQRMLQHQKEPTKLETAKALVKLLQDHGAK